MSKYTSFVHYSIVGVGGLPDQRSANAAPYQSEVNNKTSHKHNCATESCYSSRQWSSLRWRHRPTTSILEALRDQPGSMISCFKPRMPSCASLLTSTATARYPIHFIVPRLLFVVGGLVSLSLVASQHRRSFVFKVLIKELSIRSIMIRWFNPFPWYDAWESYAYASGTV
jgi:hypothetical protein